MCKCAVCGKEATREVHLSYEVGLCDTHYDLFISIAESVLYGLEDHFVEMDNKTNEG